MLGEHRWEGDLAKNEVRLLASTVPWQHGYNFQSSRVEQFRKENPKQAYRGVPDEKRLVAACSQCRLRHLGVRLHCHARHGNLSGFISGKMMLTWVRTEETTEGPVPAGLGNLRRLSAPGELFGLGDALIAAAAEGNSGQSVQEDPGGLQARWLQASRKRPRIDNTEDGVAAE